MIPIDNVGAVGMMFDRQPHEIPPEAWTSLRNCRCIDRSLWSTYGHQAIMGVPRHVAYYLQSTVDVTEAMLWAYCGTAAISATDGTTHQDITRTVGGAYTGTDAALWNGGNFGGISILNNGVDVPQAWIVPALGTPLVNLANWPANTTAKVVRPLGRVLVALDVTVSGVRKPTLVKWSDEADIGTVPVTWDPADATKKAGEWPLLETSGACVDMLPLGERGIIYKTDSAHTMTRIAGRYVFAFKAIAGFPGILAQRCVGLWENKHIVATPDDLVWHDGFQIASLLDDRMQRWYAGRVDQTYAFRSFLAINYAENEVWTCIPESGEAYPNVAMITNIKDGTTTVRDLQDFSHIDYGRPPGQSQVYDSFTIPYDSMVGYFGQSQGNSARKRMIAIAPLAERNQFFQSEDASTTWAATNVTIQTNVEGTADGVRPTAGAGQHYIVQGYTKLAAESQTWTVRVKAKPDGYNFLVISAETAAVNGGRACFNLTTGAFVTALVGTGFVIVDAGVNGSVDASGYWDCYLTVQTDAFVSVAVYFGVNQTLTTSFESYVGDGTSRIRVKEMQFRRGLLGTYQATTTLRATTGFFLIDAGSDFDGVPFTARAERTGLAVIGQTRTGEAKSDFSLAKLFTEVQPKLEMISGDSVQFYGGMQNRVKGPVLWKGPFTFTPAVDVCFNPDVEGLLMALAIETSNREIWRLDGYDIDVKKIGKKVGPT